MGIPPVSAFKVKKTLLGSFQVLFQCPHCQSELRSKESELSEQDWCPECKQPFRISPKAIAKIESLREQALAEKNRKAEEKKAIAEQKRQRALLKRCPYCAEDIQSTAIKCRYCGESVGTKPVQRIKKTKQPKIVAVSNRKTKGVKKAGLRLPSFPLLVLLSGFGGMFLVGACCIGMFSATARQESPKREVASQPPVAKLAPQPLVSPYRSPARSVVTSEPRQEKPVKPAPVDVVATKTVGTESHVAPIDATPDIVGKVIRITDGDTLVIFAEKQHRIRLNGIDSPEHSQPFGNKAKRALLDKVFEKDVRVEWEEHDRYGRIIGDVFLGSRLINREMVQDGWAWHYRKYSSDKELAAAETNARSSSRGLWADPKPIPPWDFRNGVAATPVNRVRSNRETDQTVYITDTGSKYHRGSCRHLRKSKTAISLTNAKRSYSPCKTCRPPQ